MGVAVGVGVCVGVAVGVGVNVAVAVGVDVGVVVAVCVGVGVADAVGFCSDSDGSAGAAGVGDDAVSFAAGVVIASATGASITDCPSDGVAVGVGVSVGATYGVAVGADSVGTAASLAVSGVGAAVPVQAIARDAAASRATNAPATATAIGFLLEAILGCPARFISAAR